MGTGLQSKRTVLEGDVQVSEAPSPVQGLPDPDAQPRQPQVQAQRGLLLSRPGEMGSGSGREAAGKARQDRCSRQTPKSEPRSEQTRGDGERLRKGSGREGTAGPVLQADTQERAALSEPRCWLHLPPKKQPYHVRVGPSSEATATRIHLPS